MTSAVALVPAAGEGRRFGGTVHKAFAALDGRPLIWCTLDRLTAATAVTAVVVALHADDLESWEALPGLGEARATWRCPVHVVAGGATRAHSVGQALDTATRLEVPGTLACVHDAARPWVSPDAVDAVIRAAADTGAAALARPVTDTIKQVDAAGRLTTPPRSELRAMQTPQVIRRDILAQAYSRWREAGEPPVTDDLQLIEPLDVKVMIVEGALSNKKVTFAADLEAS